MDMLDAFSSSCGTDLVPAELLSDARQNCCSYSLACSSALQKSSLFLKETIIDSSCKCYPTMKQLYSMCDTSFTHNELVLPAPISDLTSSSLEQHCEKYVLICNSSDCTCLFDALNMEDDSKCTDKCKIDGSSNDQFALSISKQSKEKTVDICDVEACEKSSFVSDSACDHNSNINKMPCFLNCSKDQSSNSTNVKEPPIKTSTPIHQNSTPKEPGLSPWKLVSTPCQQLKMQFIEEISPCKDTPLQNFLSSSLKFCSTPLTLNAFPSSTRHLKFNNVSSIYEELLDANEEFRDFRSLNVYNRCDTYSLSSSYYSVSDSSDSSLNLSDSCDSDELKKAVEEPLSCSSIESLIDETQIVQQALKRYKKELDISEAKFELSQIILEEELLEEERESMEELKILRSEVRKEIEVMEKQLSYRAKSLNNGNQNFNPLVCLEVVEKMMDLLRLCKEC